MEARYEAASPDATYKMQTARDKDEIWITVSKSGILPRCASTMGNTSNVTVSVTSPVRVYVSVPILMKPVMILLLSERKRKSKDPGSCAHTKSLCCHSWESGISRNRHCGWVSVNDNRGTVTILYRCEIRLLNLVCVCACCACMRTRAEDEIVILIVFVTGNRFS